MTSVEPGGTPKRAVLAANAGPQALTNVLGLTRATFLPRSVPAAAVKRGSRMLHASERNRDRWSTTMNPALCLVSLYLSPGLPIPKTRISALTGGFILRKNPRRRSKALTGTSCFPRRSISRPCRPLHLCRALRRRQEPRRAWRERQVSPQVRRPVLPPQLPVSRERPVLQEPQAWQRHPPHPRQERHPRLRLPREL